MLVGEKSSLRDDLVAIAEKYQADWYLPDGEISDTHIELMARSGVLDPRPLVLMLLRRLRPVRSPDDPVGDPQAAGVRSTSRVCEGLQFMTYRALLTPDQVRAYDLPESPLSPKEKRADHWQEANGVEQTEVDALMDKDRTGCGLCGAEQHDDDHRDN